MNAENFLEGASARLLFLDHITIFVIAIEVFIAVAILKVLTWSPHHFTFLLSHHSLTHYHHHPHQSTSIPSVCIQSLIFQYPSKYRSAQYKAYITEQNNYLWFNKSTELKGSLLFGYFTYWMGVLIKVHLLKTSKSWPNLDSEYRPRFSFITSTKHQQQNVDQNSAQKSRRNFNFKILT